MGHVMSGFELRRQDDAGSSSRGARMSFHPDPAHRAVPAGAFTGERRQGRDGRSGRGRKRTDTRCCRCGSRRSSAASSRGRPGGGTGLSRRVALRFGREARSVLPDLEVPAVGSADRPGTMAASTARSWRRRSGPGGDGEGTAKTDEVAVASGSGAAAARRGSVANFQLRRPVHHQRQRNRVASSTGSTASNRLPSSEMSPSESNLLARIGGRRRCARTRRPARSRRPARTPPEPPGTT